MRRKLRSVYLNEDLRLYRVTLPQIQQIASTRELEIFRTRSELFSGRVIFQVYGLTELTDFFGYQYQNHDIIAEGSVISSAFSKGRVLYLFDCIDINPFPEAMVVPKPCLIL